MSQTHDSSAEVLPTQPVLLCCAPSLFLVCSLTGHMVLCQELGSLCPLSFAPLPELHVGNAEQLPPSPSTLEGNMLFLDDRPQGATNRYYHHTQVV